MFTHCVFFWLKPGLSADEVTEFETGLSTLPKISSVQSGTWGTPANTKRDVIDSSYSYGLMVAFKDLAGHDHYQDHPVHDAFRDTAMRLCAKVQVYDFD